MTNIKKIFTFPDLCSGCELCEMVCSGKNFGEFSKKKSNVHVKKNEKGISIPIVNCNANNVKPKGCAVSPKCVEVCPTGALVYTTPEDFVKKQKELKENRDLSPIFKVIAPWKWPYPWKKWQFEEEF